MASVTGILTDYTTTAAADRIVLNSVKDHKLAGVLVRLERQRAASAPASRRIYCKTSRHREPTNRNCCKT